jgi:hypothetical protein
MDCVKYIRFQLSCLLQITAEEEYTPLCTFLETLLTMIWCVASLLVSG